jgi:hypothetical protein
LQGLVVRIQYRGAESARKEPEFEEIPHHLGHSKYLQVLT